MTLAWVPICVVGLRPVEFESPETPRKLLVSLALPSEMFVLPGVLLVSTMWSVMLLKLAVTPAAD